MKGINQVHYIGSLTQNSGTKYTAGGLAILELTVAGKEVLTKSDGIAKTSVFYNRAKLLASTPRRLPIRCNRAT